MLRSNISMWEYVPGLFRTPKAMIIYNGFCLLIILLALTACAPEAVLFEGMRGRPGEDGSSCSVAQVPDGAIISCTDGTSAVVLNGTTGTAGIDGQPGEPGVAGTSCTVNQTSSGAIVSCADGTVAVLENGQDGSNGSDGHNGSDGQNGNDGEDGEDGNDGATGPQGPAAPINPYSIVEIINPCGDNAGYDEVLFRLANGQILAHYAGGGNLQFLTLIGAGSWVTTDSSACHFTVSAAGVVTW